MNSANPPSAEMELTDAQQQENIRKEVAALSEQQVLDTRDALVAKSRDKLAYPTGLTVDELTRLVACYQRLTTAPRGGPPSAATVKRRNFDPMTADLGF